jgi:hypothetical protein
MATTINADTSTGGVVLTGDGSGVLELQAAGVTKATLNSSGMTLASPLPVGSGGTGATSLSGLTTGTATNLAGGSNGTIPYQSAAGTTQMLAVGTSGQLLQSNGAAAPTWVTPSSGALTLLSTVTASNSATIDIEAFSATYDNYFLIVKGVRPGTTNNTLRCQFKLSGAYDTSAVYRYHANASNVFDATYSSFNGYSEASIRISNFLDKTQSQSTFGCVMNILDVNETSFYRGVTWTGLTINNSSNATTMAYGIGSNNGTTSALTGIRFLMSAGNILLGTFQLYGIAKS